MTQHLVLPGTCVSSFLYNIRKDDLTSYSKVIVGTTKAIATFTKEEEVETRKFLESCGFSTHLINKGLYFHSASSNTLKYPDAPKKKKKVGEYVYFGPWGTVQYEVLSYSDYDGSEMAEIRSTLTGRVYRVFANRLRPTPADEAIPF